MPRSLVAHCKRDMTPCTLSAWPPKAIGFRHRLPIIGVDSSRQLSDTIRLDRVLWAAMNVAATILFGPSDKKNTIVLRGHG
jgi:hypothetical protein